tara:strand:+ start:1714 stop:2439 length:726 start_codon:yes stop_codon:yes gene_type:complete
MKKPKLLIKAPTRSRPEKFKEVISKYINFLSGKHYVRILVTVDLDDETMNNEEMRKWMDEKNEEGKKAGYYEMEYKFGNSKSKIEAVNNDMEGEEFDILLLFSDDMIPQIENYDDIIVQNMEHHYPDCDGALNFNDGLRPDWPRIMTLAILSRPIYESMGHIYNPEYKSVYADDEQTTVCRLLGKLTNLDLCIIRHEWLPGNHPDADEMHAEQESPEMYAYDRAIFERRMSENFGIDPVEV